MAFQTLSELYGNSIRSYGSRRSFSMFERESMSYNDFDDRVELVRGILLGAGISSGDKVALLSNNMPNWGVCYFAAVTAGIVVVPILPDFSPEELEMIIDHSDAKALFVSDKLFSKVSKKIIARMNVVIRTKNLGVIARNSSELGTAREPEPDDLAVIIYTSGTTSKPKGVMHTHRSLCQQLAMDYDLFPINENDVFLSILPLSHTYECSLGMLYPFMQGAAVVYLDRPPTASNLLLALKEVRPTVMLSVPLIIDKIYRSQVKGRFTATDFWRFFYEKRLFRLQLHRLAGKKLMKIFGGRLRFFGIGGAKLDTETEQFLLDARFPYAIGYGLTETAPLIAGAVPDRVRLGSTGPVLSQIEARLDNVNTAGEGELVVRTPSIMFGYYKNPEATRDAFTSDGWFRTKDLAAFDEDGYLYIKGRLSSMIVGPSGENIYPEDIESVLNSHAFVIDSIVTEERGKLVALVHFDRKELERRYYDLRDNLTAKKEELKADIMKYVNSKVNKFSRISAIKEQENDFEKTPTQKIKRYLYAKKKQ